MDDVSFPKQVLSDTFFEKELIARVDVDAPLKVCTIDKGQVLRKGQVLTAKGVETRKDQKTLKEKHKKKHNKKHKKKQPWWYKEIMKDQKTLTLEEYREKHKEKLRKELIVEKKRKVDFI